MNASRRCPLPLTGLTLLVPVCMIGAAAEGPEARAGAGSGEKGAVRERVLSQIERDYSSLEALYRHLHAHPELSSHEVETARRIAAELAQAGFEVTSGLGGHGVVGLFRNGAGPTILLRTDLDALPVMEETGLSYASTARVADDKGNEVPVMHACGHDVHMTVFVGAARLLARSKDLWGGTLVMIGQPAEEIGRGARAMLADGLFTRFPRPDLCLALHVNAFLPAGTLGWVEGPALANSDTVDITFRGVGGHGAWPHTTRDPVVLAAQAVLAFQTIVSRETEPGTASVVTVGSIHGGFKHNIISDEVKLQLTVRSFNDSVREATLASIRRISLGLAQAAGVPADRMPEIKNESTTPLLQNDTALTRRVVGILGDWFGAEKTVQVKPVMGGEDFSEYGRTVERIPICMFWLGSVDPRRFQESREGGLPLPSLHSPLYHPQAEPTIKTGVTALAAAVLDLAKKR